MDLALMTDTVRSLLPALSPHAFAAVVLLGGLLMAVCTKVLFVILFRSPSLDQGLGPMVGTLAQLGVFVVAAMIALEEVGVPVSTWL